MKLKKNFKTCPVAPIHKTIIDAVITIISENKDNPLTNIALLNLRQMMRNFQELINKIKKEFEKE